MIGGEIDKQALIESFSRIKEDITKLKIEIEELKKELENNKKNNIKQIYTNQNNTNQTNTHYLQTEKNKITNEKIDIDLIKIIVKEAVESALKKPKNPLLEKINKKRKNMIINRILSLAEQKNLSLPEIKEIIVDQETLCSKATFYRYIEKLKKKQMIDIIKVDEYDVLVKIEKNQKIF